MRKLLMGGIALLATMLLNAEDTKVLSYNGMIDDQIRRIDDGNTEVKQKDSEQSMQAREREKDAEQRKWNKLSQEEQHKIEAKRTEKRDEAIAMINKKIEELDNDAQKLADKKAGMMDREKFDRKQRMIDEKKSKLMEMKAKIESAPEGQNVDMDAPRMTQEEINNPSRH